MVSNQLLNDLHNLNHTDKIMVMQFLANEIAQEAGVPFQFGREYEVWSPEAPPETINALMQMLEDAKRKDTNP